MDILIVVGIIVAFVGVLLVFYYRHLVKTFPERESEGYRKSMEYTSQFNDRYALYGAAIGQGKFLPKYPSSAIRVTGVILVAVGLIACGIGIALLL